MQHLLNNQYYINIISILQKHLLVLGFHYGKIKLQVMLYDYKISYEPI